jgi:Membrane-bound metallopeptidase
MLMKKKLLCILLAVLIFVVFSVPAFAGDIDDIKDKIGDSNDRIEQINGQLSTLEEQIDDTNKQYNALQNSITSTNNEIASLKVKINDSQNKINAASRELDDAVAEYNKQDEMMSKRINALYKNDTGVGFLQVVLESTSFADFISRADILKKIVDNDLTMLKEMKQKREEINKKKIALEADKTQLDALNSNLNAKKTNLVKQSSDKKALVSRMNDQKGQLNYELRQEEATAQKLQQDLAALMSKNSTYSGEKFTILHTSDFPSGKSPRITSGFGYRIDPITGAKSAYHSGIDIGTAGLVNIPVYAMASGKVIIARWYGGYGYCVVIDHGSGLATLYGHNNKLLVTEGQIVTGGQKISLSGSTGRSTGPHVHFGVQKNNQWIDPSPYLLLN